MWKPWQTISVKIMIQMVDNVWTRHPLKTSAQANMIENSLPSDAKPIYDKNKVEGKRWLIDNLEVRVFPYALYTQGSLARFFFGTNLYELDINNALDVVIMLSDTLHFDMDKAIITHLEIGKIIEMQHSPNVYLSRFGRSKSRNMKRQPTDYDTVYYKAGCKNFKAYDKVNEAQNHHLYVPKQFENSNLLKIEFTMTKNIKGQLKLNRVPMLQDISNPIVWRSLEKKLASEYSLTTKVKDTSLKKFENLKGKDAYNALCARALEFWGYDNIAKFNIQLGHPHAFVEHGRARYNKKLDEVMKIWGDEDDAIIKELDTAVYKALKIDDLDNINISNTFLPPIV